ncbi:unnamed protein product, partial [Gulo gulo]
WRQKCSLEQSSDFAGGPQAGRRTGCQRGPTEKLSEGPAAQWTFGDLFPVQEGEDGRSRQVQAPGNSTVSVFFIKTHKY